MTDDAPVARRLAAIVAADVVGFSRLVGTDETGTLAALRQIRRDIVDPHVAKHGGRIFKTTGDGVLAEFPSAVMALEAAIAVQEKMRAWNSQMPAGGSIEFRIGVHQGDVVVEGDDLLGDGVNVAARLEAMAEPGGICISARVFEDASGRIAIDARDMGELALKNIARSVRAYAVQVYAAAGATPQRHQQAASGAPRLSIVVLPFANIGGDPEQEYFVDGVTESLTTDLSRIGGSFVIARNTAFTFKGKPVDVKTIGREFNVRYVLEGSVQRGGNRMRVNVQLIATETGSHLWAERFDKPLADLFDMQDEIVARLAGQLGTQLLSAEARRSASVPIPDSMDFYFQGMAWLNKGVIRESLETARGFFESALTLDPGNVEALVGGALVDVFVGGNFDDDSARMAAAETALSEVLSSAPEHALARAWLGRIKIGSKRALEGIAECERALVLDPNLASAHAFIGLAKSAVGRAEETEAHVRDALRLSPRDTYAYRWFIIAGFARLSLGFDEEAAEWLRRSIEANRNAPVAHIGLAAALALLGRIEEARCPLRVGLALDPAFTINRFRIGAASDNPQFLMRRERIYEGMRKVGVPEG